MAPSSTPSPASPSAGQEASLSGSSAASPSFPDAPRRRALPVRAQDLDRVRYDAAGLVPAVVQEAGTGQVLMMAWMTEATLQCTLETGRMTYWSRSRQEVWVKGETSGERQWVRAGYYDCDGDTLLFVVDQEGQGACHTGEHSCFYRAFGGGAGVDDSGTGRRA